MTVLDRLAARHGVTRPELAAALEGDRVGRDLVRRNVRLRERAAELRRAMR